DLRRLVAPANPLVSRVIVNRLWQHHFGNGLVRTPDDFGRMGQPPTHPELLDYLAADFVRTGWSVKTATRRMVTSSAYRQSSALIVARSSDASPNPSLIDPDNRLLYRMPIHALT